MNKDLNISSFPTTSAPGSIFLCDFSEAYLLNASQEWKNCNNILRKEKK